MLPRRDSTPIVPGGLGARLPEHKPYVEKYPAKLALAPATLLVVEKSLELPWWHWNHDQGAEGACVGFGTTMMMTILNMRQRRMEGIRPFTLRYDPWWLWDRAKEVDYWSDTNPGDGQGTSVDGACRIAHDHGLVKYPFASKLLPYGGFTGTPDPAHGIATYRWATEVDEMRSAIAQGTPISIGVNWYSDFDQPVKASNQWWIAKDGIRGQVRGGHCVTIYGASDKRGAFRVKNSWGRNYPLVWMPYTVMERLLQEHGEAVLVTDR